MYGACLYGIDVDQNNAMVLIPYDTTGWGWVNAEYSRFYSNGSSEVAYKSVNPSTDMAADPNEVYAVFTVAGGSSVPVPGALMLLGTGMLALAGMRRRTINYT